MRKIKVTDRATLLNRKLFPFGFDVIYGDENGRRLNQVAVATNKKIKNHQLEWEPYEGLLLIHSIALDEDESIKMLFHEINHALEAAHERMNAAHKISTYMSIATYLLLCLLAFEVLSHTHGLIQLIIGVISFVVLFIPWWGFDLIFWIAERLEENNYIK